MADGIIGKYEGFTLSEEQMLDILKSAYRDRIVILPCRMGDPIYMVVTKYYYDRPDKLWFAYVKNTKLTKYNFFAVIEGMGTNVFLTRAEADARLECLKGLSNEAVVHK